MLQQSHFIAFTDINFIHFF